MRLFEIGGDTIEFIPVSCEMNNFDNWISITYAESSRAAIGNET
jgi:hypothetical protein